MRRKVFLPSRVLTLSRTRKHLLFELRASDLIRLPEPGENAERDGGSVTSPALRCQLGQCDEQDTTRLNMIYSRLGRNHRQLIRLQRLWIYDAMFISETLT
jgi:hypothetical protein